MVTAVGPQSLPLGTQLSPEDREGQGWGGGAGLPVRLGSKSEGIKATSGLRLLPSLESEAEGERWEP